MNCEAGKFGRQEWKKKLMNEKRVGANRKAAEEAAQLRNHGGKY